MAHRLIYSLLLGSVVLALTACGGGSDSGSTTPTPKLITLPAARGLLPDQAVADINFKSAHFSGNGECTECHNDQAADTAPTMIDGMGRDLSIVKAWESSMMANAARDPYWHAVVETELSLYPQHSEELNDTCTRCHTPMANEVGRRTASPIQPFDSGSEENGDFIQGFLSMDESDETYNHAMDGVSCTLCHQIADDGNLGTEASMTGGFFIEQYPEEQKSERPAYGQYQDVDAGYMQGKAEFEPVYGAHISTSETCATCHNLTTESVDRDGVPIEGNHFPEQAIYSEWEVSDYRDNGPQAQSCQDCHMPIVENDVPVASGEENRPGFAEHTFLGANTVMMNVMNEFRDELGVPEGVDFESAIQRNREFLQTSASLEMVSNQVEGETLAVLLDVVNHTGHKLPSAYHSRRVWLHVVVTDSSGQQIYENGRMRPNGSIVGVAEDVNPDSWEPHYDTITSATEVQVYQSIMGNSDDEKTHSLLNGAYYLKDNRLTPAGFNKATAPDTVAVAGLATEDANFNLGKDRIRYEIPVSGNGPYNVLVELRYQPLSHGHLLQLFSRSDELDRVDMFRTMYQNTTLKAETLTAVQGVSGN